MQNGRRGIPVAPCRALTAPALIHGSAAGRLGQAWVGVIGLQHGKTMDMTVLHQ